jgi:hypothetical protein
MTSSASTLKSVSHDEYKLYTYKPLSFGFIVLCADNNPNRVKATVQHLRNNYAYPSVAVVCEDTHKDDIAMLKKVCPTHTGGKTITSLINAGMKKPPADWNFIIIGGSYVQANLDKKFSFFIEKYTDILYPIADYKYNFVDATLNGLLLHKDMWKEVGDMGDANPLEICKLLWAMQAMDKKCKFKAIIGTKIC